MFSQTSLQMDYIDITLPLSEKIPVFPGDPEVRLTPIERDGYRITSLCVSSHSGTHIDAPLHYIPDGPGVDSIPLENINGESVVIDLTSVKRTVAQTDIEGRTCDLRIIILKTGFSTESDSISEYTSISCECAQYLSEAGVTCIVTDAPSIESFDGDGSVHRTLLENNIAIIEMADLSAVQPGRYILNALPLRIGGCDGSPVRAVLLVPKGDSD